MMIKPDSGRDEEIALMTYNEKWADYDLAKFGLSLAIGRRSELFFQRG